MAFSHSTSRLGRRVTPSLAAIPAGIDGKAVPKADEWLSLAEAATFLELRRNDPALKALWERMAAAAASGEPTILDGVAIRAAVCAMRGGDQLCVHRRHVPIIGGNLAAPPPAKAEVPVMPRKPGWLTMTRVAEALGMGSADARIRAVWRNLIDMAEAGTDPACNGTPVRFEFQGQAGVNSWCMHRDDLRILSANLDRSDPRQTRPAGWVTKEEGFAQHGEGVDSGVFFEAWRVLAREARNGRTPAAHGVTVTMGLHVVGATERWLMPAADAAAVAAATRGIAPRPSDRFIPLQTVLARITSDAKPMASRMLSAMARSERRVRPEAGGPEVVGFRLMEVEGRPTPCMRADYLPAFAREVRVRHDEHLVRTADDGSRWDIMADMADRRLGM